MGFERTPALFYLLQWLSGFSFTNYKLLVFMATRELERCGNKAG
jgi:hypothetical protein